MRLRLLTAALLAIAFGAVACGDGASDPPTATPTQPVTFTQEPARPTITVAAGRTITSFGDAPTLGGHVNRIYPEYAQRIPQIQTRSPNPANPQGVCAEVDFEGLEQNVLWFRFALDGVELTTSLIWVVPSQENPTEGKMCYAPEEGLSVGIHEAAIVVQDPINSNVPSLQAVGWRFEVIE